VSGPGQALQDDPLPDHAGRVGGEGTGDSTSVEYTRFWVGGWEGYLFSWVIFLLGNFYTHRSGPDFFPGKIHQYGIFFLSPSWQPPGESKVQKPHQKMISL
jgi:hypothetical protein